MAGKSNNPNHMKNLKPFKKGDSRINRKGAPKKLPELDVLLADLLGEEKNGMTAATAILQAMFAKALKGDVRAAEMLMDRAYGTPKQTVDSNNKHEFQGFDNVQFVFKSKDK